MTESPDLLRLRVLLCFDPSSRSECTVTGIARTLGQEKYSISRILKYFSEKGIMDTSNSRHPVLTEKGEELLSYYSERVSTLVNHLLYEGVDIENARSDALSMALYNSDQSMAAIRATEETYRIKYEFRNRKRFSGSVLCRRLRDGTYRFPFVLYRESSENGDNISEDNREFSHPATLVVKDGTGHLELLSKRQKERQCCEIQYFDSGSFITAEKSAGIFTIPADVLQFVNLGAGTGEVLHGSVALRLCFNCGEDPLPDSSAIFTLLV
ncbi:MAG: hypothetical protein U0K37_02000 [Acutalibacteraceae bacterium]|nr:hypothetical protein [Acutalibacteraceae bacterium]